VSVLNHDFIKIYKITLIFSTIFNHTNHINQINHSSDNDERKTEKGNNTCQIPPHPLIFSYFLPTYREKQQEISAKYEIYFIHYQTKENKFQSFSLQPSFV
jgi:hypothetical protein